MRIALAVIATVVALAPGVVAQQPAATPPAFFTSTSYHVAEESRSALEAWMKDRYRRFAVGLMKEDASILAVLATRTIFGGVSEPEANFYVVTVTNGVPKPAGNVRDKVARQLFNKSYEEFLAEARPWRKRLGQTLSRLIVGTEPVVAEGDVMRVDMKKVAAGRMQDYVQLERDYLRLRAAQVKAGRMTAWSMNTVVLPAGTSRDFDAYTVHLGKSLEQVLGWGQGTTEIAAKLDPPFNLAGFSARGTELQTIVRGEARVVVFFAQRQ